MKLLVSALALTLTLLSGCISSSNPNPPARTTVVVPPNSAGEDHRGGAAELEHHRCLPGWIATALQLMGGLRHEQGRS